MEEQEKGGLPMPSEPPDRPRVVEEAYEVLTTYGWQATGTGAAAIAAWLAAGWMDYAVPLSWLLAFLAVVVLIYLAPVTRAPKLAREVIRRWDELRVDRALEESGATSDPRLAVAESMAHRIIRHPTLSADVRQTAEALVNRLQILLADLRRIEWLVQSTSMDRTGAQRSFSDLQDVLDARAANVVAQLAELHRTVVLRDAAAIQRAVASVRDLLDSLEAEDEVERFLLEAEDRPKG